ncbi:MAG: hypothetical protein D6718_07395 [Acidobacteria bacterium]|nr:MAG: hypothetical protein D6718_07395 [Acidobacteriota bacterium]
MATDARSPRPESLRAVRPPARAALVLLAVLAGTPGIAQTPTRDEPFPLLLDARRWGPFLVRPAFSIDNIGYDSNVYLVPPGEPARSDYVIRLGPEIDAQIRFGRRVALTLRDKLAGEVFVKTSSLNHADNDFSGQLDTILGPVLLTGAARWSTLRLRPNSAEDARSRRDDRRIRGAARLFLGPRTDFVLAAERQRIRYSDPDPGGELIAERLDEDAATLELEAGWRLSSGTRFFGSFKRREHDFTIDREGRDSSERRIELGVGLEPSRRIEGELRLGRVRFEPATGRFRPFRGGVGALSFTYRPTGRARIRGSLRRDVFFSTFSGNLFFDSRSGSLSAETFLGRLFGVQAGVSRRDLQFPETTPVPFENPADTRRRDRIANDYVGVLFYLGRETIFSVRYGRRVRDSNVIGFDDTQYYVATSGSFTF